MRNAFIVCGVIVVSVAIGGLVFVYGGENFSGALPSEAINNNPITAVAVPFTELASGTQSNISTRKNYLITSASELQKLWGMIDVEGNPPAVDFTKNTVAAIFAGTEPTTGYAIAVSKVEDTNVRTVTVTLTKPGNSCVEGQLVTAPYVLIELSKTSLRFTHEDQVATNECI